MFELLTPAEMFEADRLTIASGTPGETLMEHAGRAVADAVADHLPVGTRIAIVAGPGNNGGDGYVAARLLAERGYRVDLLPIVAPDRLQGDAARAAARWAGGAEAAVPDALAGADAVVDAMFGAGLDRPIAGNDSAMIDAIIQRGIPVIAVDLPSGINGATGAVMGTAVKATETVTFFHRKPGHVLLPGRLHCGTVRVADIGILPAVLERITPKTFLNVPETWGHPLPRPSLDGHKYLRGHAVVVSGGVTSTGAGRLSARGALRAGAGLVTLASPREALAVNAAANLAIMVRAVDGARELAALLQDRRFNAVVLGPGGGVGAPMREQVEAVLAGERAVVLDADALTSFADHLGALAKMIAQRSGDAATVLTPHQGEFSRLFNNVPHVLEPASKIDQARAASAYTGAVVLLKGPDTVVAAPDGRATVADNAPPWLATAGSGDVLAGMIGGLLAQGMPAFAAASAGVWLHGECGTEAGRGLISEDLPEALPAVLRRYLQDA